jgi:hypothetical protein
MQLLSFWIVTHPTVESVLCDICVAVTPAQFVRQVRGGLGEADLAGCFTDEAEAQTMARALLAARDGAMVPASFIGDGLGGARGCMRGSVLEGGPDA